MCLTLVALKQAKYLLVLTEETLGFLLRDGTCCSWFISDIMNDVDLFKQSCSVLCFAALYLCAFVTVSLTEISSCFHYLDLFCI